MNPAAILALISDLYQQINTLGQRNADLEAEIKDLHNTEKEGASHNG